MTSIEEMIKLVNETGDHKVISKFKRIDCYNEPDDQEKFIGIFLDVETTGSDVNVDQITELALVPFQYSSDGKIYKVLESYIGFQDPKIPIPENIIQLTGITNEMVANQSLDHDRINELISSASIIIAHNATFDKKFLVKILPVFKDKVWGCTARHIDWRSENIPISKLEYLAYTYGVFFKGHRAEIDSLIGIHILAQSLPLSKQPVLKILLENTSSKYYKVWAENSPFEKKDILKERKYRWNDGRNSKPKSWYTVVNEKLKDEELEFLQKEIYGKDTVIKTEGVTLCDDI